ncbi:uncharacterized protein LOC135681381 isoform X2 [Rhopilema esculentum]|uniref:uncharacterized protein LOC135681381 isoform X2 n=1 Tax=Rhopilema esculentum TaxID=499914 RepID=UPI0031DA33F4
MAAVIRLGNKEVLPATTEGSENVFSQKLFTLEKRRWMKDEEVHLCPLCNNKFSQIRRKHHCRQCGRIFCSKCCDSKVSLSQLGYDEPQRVCESCAPVCEIMSKARSPQFAKKLEAAQSLAQMTKEIESLIKVVELGGIQTLIYLSQSINDGIKASVADAIHTLATQTVLHPLLVRCGAIKAICSMLSAVDESQEKTLIDAVSALMIFCKSDDLKAQAVSDGALHPVLSLCEMKEHIALLAIMTLSLIVEHQANLAALVEDGKGSLQKIVTLTSAKDEKMQEIAFKILASLSLGTDWQRHRIVQENYVNNKCFVEAIRRKPKNQQVLVNAACLIGNLSTCEQDQSSLRECLEAICTLVTSHPQQKDIQLQVSRAIANFSKYQVNCIALVNHLSDFIAVHLKSNVAEIRTHAVRSIIHLLSHAKEEVLTVLRRNGLEDLLSILIDVNGITDAIQNVLLQSVKERNRPMSL